MRQNAIEEMQIVVSKTLLQIVDRSCHSSNECQQLFINADTNKIKLIFLAEIRKRVGQKKQNQTENQKLIMKNQKHQNNSRKTM